MTTIPSTATPLDRLHAALRGGSVPDDLITPLRDLLHQLDHATGAAARAAERYSDVADVAKRSAYCETSLDVVLNAFARLGGVAPLADGTVGPPVRGRLCVRGRPTGWAGHHSIAGVVSSATSREAQVTMSSYGHAEKIAAIAAARTPPAKDTHPIDPQIYERSDVRRILANRDIEALFRLLKDQGITQRVIAELVSMQQSQVSEILGGRKVVSYDVLVRITEGLNIPRKLMGLSYGERDAYTGHVPVVSLEEVAEMLRRRVLAMAPIATLAANPIVKLAELLTDFDLPDLIPPAPLPSQIRHVHITKVLDTTRRLAEDRRIYGSDPEMNSAAADQATRLLNVPGTDDVTKALMAAVSQLHLQAGWTAFDSDLYHLAMYHYSQALELAIRSDDAYFQALALSWAGGATIENGDPNEGLKLLQFGGTKVLDVPSELDPTMFVVGYNSRISLQAQMLADSAIAYHRLDYPETEQKADTNLAESRELWSPTPADKYGDVDGDSACIALDRGQLDKAESHAVSSLRRWEGVSTSKVGRVNSATVLATIHVRAGEPRGLQLAHSAIAATDNLTSIRPRKRLVPLVAALDARSRTNSDARELARMARQVAATCA